MLIDEQDIVLEAGIEMWLETQVDDDGIVVTVDVGVYSIQALENLPDCLIETLGEWDTCAFISTRAHGYNYT
jgi:hypothetical protein